ncbi:hypothetical protein P389DRAFT_173105 [Cystobasidium minutum MCA 4210]|uniref:uncharacterized protein n=1 Tax=Cystobasidium minutum MCA 4210 TaxID=1397322 RepID=UPI0034CD8E87|eukprot:jgi/Rhomi1/173105/fgenesh1_kg.5_\
MKYLLLAVLALAATSQAQDLLNDKLNCGKLNHVCHENDGVASCVAGFCKLVCDIGFVNKNGICVQTKASRKERLHMPLTLCPTGETACPIIGSRSFEEYNKHAYSHEVAEMLSAKGGYECLDVSTSLENCGGCAATGEGRDCTKISHVDGVGCGGGQCQVFSCKKGYAPSLNGLECSRKTKVRLGGHGHGKGVRHHS